MNEREVLHDLKRRASAIAELIHQLNLDIAKVSLAYGGKINEDKAWFRWFCRVFAKSGTLKTVMSDLNIFMRKAVESYGNNGDSKTGSED